MNQRASQRRSCGHHTRPPPIRLLYCGADSNWDDIDDRAVRRRNLFLLRAFIDDGGIEPIHVLFWVSRRRLIRRWLSKLLRRGYSEPFGASAVPVVRWLPERSWLPGSVRLNRAFARLLVRWRVGSDSSSCTVVWCYALRGIALAEFLNLKGAWFIDTDHDVVNDPNLRSRNRSQAKDLLLRAAKRARHVFSASRNNLRWLREGGVVQCTRLRNGVSVGRFEPPKAEGPAVTPETTPTLGYIGVLSPWVDFPFLLELARLRADWRFVIAGPWYRMKPPTELEQLDNVELRGPVESQLVPGLIKTFDLGLGLYRQEPWLDVDSMKFFEYLAAGVPVLSTPFHPNLVEDFEGLVAIGETILAFEERAEEIFSRTLSERQRWQTRRRYFVERNSWKLRSRQATSALRMCLAAPHRRSTG